MVAACSSAAAQTTVGAADGSYAVAAPGLPIDRVGPAPVLAGRSVIWATTSDDRLTAIRSAGGDVVSNLYSPPRQSRDSGVTGIAASATHVAVLRDGIWKRPACRPRKCGYIDGELLAGPVGGPLERMIEGERAFRNRSGCRRGTAFLFEAVVLEPAILVSGHRALYQERLHCPKQWRKSHYELVLHDLRTGKRRVVHRGDVDEVQLAGRYLAYAPVPRESDELRPPGTLPGSRIVVRDTRTGEAVYVTPSVTSSDGVLHWPSLDSDGTLVAARTAGISLDAELGWFSPLEPRFHPLPPASIFTGKPLLAASGRVAFVRELDGGGHRLAVTDLQGNAETYGEFRSPEQLIDFAFDGERIAWVMARSRPYRGRRDRGLPSFCDFEGRPRVLVEAPVIEVHRLGRPGRLPAASLPRVAAPRDPGLLPPPYC